MVTLLAAVALLPPLDGLAVGEKVVFEARNQQGTVVRSASLNRPTVLLLWGPWSNGSARALVEISNLKKADPRPRYVALASWDEPDNVTEFLATVQGVDLDIWLDPAQKNASESIAVKAFKTRRFPSVYVLDRQQRVAGSFLGYKPTDDVKSLVSKVTGPGD
jgi:thioredoxin-like negative regulator of GroEL